jgi:hypothetical protein
MVLIIVSAIRFKQENAYPAFDVYAVIVRKIQKYSPMKFAV